MNGIPLTPVQYKFLKMGMTKDSQRMNGKMSTYMLNETGLLFTTNGYSMYILRVSAEMYKSGYYVWSDENNILLRVDDRQYDKNPNLIDSAMKVRQSTLDSLMYTEPMKILSFTLGQPNDGFNIDILPNAKSKVGVAFRKGLYQGEWRSICLGQNYSTLYWDEQNRTAEVKSIAKDDLIVVDAQLLYPIVKAINPETMLWRDHKSSAIIGNVEGDHAIVMPLLVGGR